jgi:hypothetical protein
MDPVTAQVTMTLPWCEGDAGIRLSFCLFSSLRIALFG